MGMVLALVLIGFALWPDFEAALFDTNNARGESLNSLHCPLLITPSDAATIRLTLTNPLDKPVNFLVRANISEKFVSLIRQEQGEARLQPGERTEFTWPIEPQDAVYGRMILARVRVLRASTLPTRQKACGVLLLNVPIVTGNQIVGGLLAMTLLYLGGGGFLWVRHERPLTGRKRELARIVGAFVLLLLLTLFFSLIGWWGSGVVIILVMFLILGAAVERFALRR